MTKPFFLATSLIGFLCAVPALAAPLDALLSASEPGDPRKVELEVGYDVVNDTVDFLGMRAKDPTFGGTNVGDYRGAHVRARWHLGNTWSVDGALWQRHIQSRDDQAEMESWQVGLQQRLTDAEGWVPALAWRVSAWGNQADRLQKTSPTTVRDVTVSSVNVHSPEDRQTQLDLIASWMVTGNTAWSVFAGAGKSRVKVREITANYTRYDCPHQVTFRPNRVVVRPTTKCDNFDTYNGVPLPEYGGDVHANTQYTAKYLQAGTSIRWQGQHWHLAAGYQFQVIDRGGFDDRLKQQGRPVYDSNHTVIGEVRYRLGRYAEVFGRGQIMAHQFVGEIPFAYNGFTSHRFDKRYGIASAGLIIEF